MWDNHDNFWNYNNEKEKHELDCNHHGKKRIAQNYENVDDPFHPNVIRKKKDNFYNYYDQGNNNYKIEFSLLFICIKERPDVETIETNIITKKEIERETTQMNHGIYKVSCSGENKTKFTYDCENV